jgi:uncharacterized RDD family membrane protein YckC
MAEEIRKAGLLLRVLAKSIDLILVLAVVQLIPQAGVAAGLLYVLVSDGLFDGRSAGKKIVHLRVFGAAGRGCTIRESVLRNAPLAAAGAVYLLPIFGWLFAAVILGIEMLLMFGNAEGKRLGDDLAGTWVVQLCAGCTVPEKSDI